MPAGELKAGDLLHTHEGTWLPVESVTDNGEVANVHNICVADFHTYFVGGADWKLSVWAHNACTEAELAEIAKLKQKPPSPLSDGSRNLRDMLGFPVRHSKHETDGHLRKMRDIANEKILRVGGKSDDTIVLYNKTLRQADNPLAIVDRGVKPDVQVFKKTGDTWARVGFPVEVEAASANQAWTKEWWKALNVKNQTYANRPEEWYELYFYAV
jgi:hypothetical protein